MPPNNNALKPADTTTQSDFITSQTLPHELILEIFAHMTPNELCLLATVAHSWKPFANDEILWNRLEAKKLPITYLFLHAALVIKYTTKQIYGIVNKFTISDEANDLLQTAPEIDSTRVNETNTNNPSTINNTSGFFNLFRRRISRPPSTSYKVFHDKTTISKDIKGNTLYTFSLNPSDIISIQKNTLNSYVNFTFDAFFTSAYLESLKQMLEKQKTHTLGFSLSQLHEHNNIGNAALTSPSVLLRLISLLTNNPSIRRIMLTMENPTHHLHHLQNGIELLYTNPIAPILSIPIAFLTQHSINIIRELLTNKFFVKLEITILNDDNTRINSLYEQFMHELTETITNNNALVCITVNAHNNNINFILPAEIEDKLEQNRSKQSAAFLALKNKQEPEAINLIQEGVSPLAEFNGLSILNCALLFDLSSVISFYQNYHPMLFTKLSQCGYYLQDSLSHLQTTNIENANPSPIKTQEQNPETTTESKSTLSLS
ncbi:MAG: F-box protein [Gammaproteobacteria bacterium]|nr:F-box protein [Gammaproteobacteria bacterium]